MFYGVGKDFGFSLAIFLRVLLTAEDDGLGSIDFVDAVGRGVAYKKQSI